jgi:hypothetical protein
MNNDEMQMTITIDGMFLKKGSSLFVGASNKLLPSVLPMGCTGFVSSPPPHSKWTLLGFLYCFSVVANRLSLLNL